MKILAITNALEARCLADLDAVWRLIGTQRLALDGYFTWHYLGAFGLEEARAWRAARDNGLIVTVMGRDPDGNLALYAKRAKHNPRWQSSHTRPLTSKRRYTRR